LVDREDFKKQVGYPNTICAKKGLQLQLKKYQEVAVGGTFGPLHKGHEELLRRAFETSDYVIIGLTSDEMVKHKQPTVPSFDQRKRRLLAYLDKSAVDHRQYTIAMIDDPASSVLMGSKITEALVVSEETYPRALEINKQRKEQGLYEFEIETVPLVMKSDGTKLSSTDIRRHDYEMGPKRGNTERACQANGKINRGRA
jgi:pantetheine-phosphate adenylyltransferase